MLIHNLVATGSLSYNGVNISYVTGSQTSLDGLNQFSASVNTTTGSLNSTTGSLNTATGSLFTASGSFSTRVTNIEGNYATTGSNIFLGAQTVCANITSTGTIIAQTLNVQQVTSSIVYSSGSNIFGCQLTDVQQMTGSVRITGSLSTVGVSCFSSAVCAPTIIGTTNINTGTSCIVDSHMLNVNGDQASVNVGLSLRNTNATYPKVFGLTNVNGNLNLYDYTANSQRLRIDTNGIACFACQKCAPGMDIMPSGIGVSTLGGIMRVVTTGTSTGIAVGQSNSNRYTHFAANDIQVFNDDFFLSTRCAFPLSIGTCYTARLTFAATGIACFSCQVCAPAAVLISNSTTVELNTSSRALKITGKDNFYAIEYIAGTTTGQSYGPYIKAGTNSSDQSFVLQNSAANKDYFTVRGDGNVGIGLADPSTSLSVYNSGGSSGYKTIKFDSNDGSNGTRVLIANRCNTACRGYALVVGGSPDGAGTDKFSIGYFACDSTFVASNMFVITCTGNVGIGTCNPSSNYSLTLNGDSSSRTGGITFRQSSTDTFYAGNPSVSNTTDFELWNPRNGYLRLATNNVERLRITSTGTVQNRGTGGTLVTQRLVGCTTAGSSGVDKEIAFIGFNHTINVKVLAYQTSDPLSSNVATLTQDIVTSFGNTCKINGGLTCYSNITNMSTGYGTGYKLYLNVTYSGAAPNVLFQIEGISGDTMTLSV